MLLPAPWARGVAGPVGICCGCYIVMANVVVVYFNLAVVIRPSNAGTNVESVHGK